jgi:heme O synthase-like polyprenyltransferase
MKYREDNARAGVPTFPSTHGDTLTQAVIAISSMLASLPTCCLTGKCYRKGLVASRVNVTQGYSLPHERVLPT